MKGVKCDMHLTGNEHGEVLIYGNKTDWELYIPLERATYLIKTGQARVVSNTTICKLDGQNTETGYIKNYVIDRDQGSCVFCRKPADKIYHIKPKYLGGKFTISNCVVACDRCKNEQNRYMQKLHPAPPKKKHSNKQITYKYKYILHCDASYKNKNGAILGIILYKYGKVVYHNSIKIPGVTDNNIAEILAIREGIKVIVRNNIPDALVVSDSKVSVDALNRFNINKINSSISPLLTQVGLLLKSSNADLKWISRSENKAADRLTRAKPKKILKEVIII